MHLPLIDLFFPKSSLTGIEGCWISTNEKKEITQSMRPLLLHEAYLRKLGLTHIDAVIAASTFSSSPLLRPLIHRYKYHRIQELHTELSSLLIQAIPGYLIPPSPYVYPVLCPVPLHWMRRLSRGFNQADLLAKDLADHFGWKAEHLITRTKNTGQQIHRSRIERLSALEKCFKWRGSKDKAPPWVVLIDDVCTTGATLNESAKALKAAGVKHVSGLTVAYG